MKIIMVVVLLPSWCVVVAVAQQLDRIEPTTPFPSTAWCLECGLIYDLPSPCTD